MHLAVLGPGHPFRGGIPRATTAMVAALAERGLKVSFVTARRQFPSWLYPGVDDRDAEACRRVEGARPWLDPVGPWSWPATRRRLLALRADAWVLPYWTSAWAPMWRALLAGQDRPPAVAVVHNLRDHDLGAVGEIGARLVLCRCAGLLTHGERLVRQLRGAYMGVPVASATLPPVAVGGTVGRDEARRRTGLPANRRIALFLGLIRPYKGLDLLLQAMAGLPPSEDWTLVVAGEPWGDLGPQLQRQVAREGLGDRVLLRLGWVPEGEVPVLLAAADVVVLPYRRGSQSAVAPMALAHGVPVVTTRVGSVAEVVEDGATGRVVEPGSPTTLRDVLLELDERRLEDLRRNVEAARGGRDGWEDYGERMEALVREVLASYSR